MILSMYSLVMIMFSCWCTAVQISAVALAEAATVSHCPHPHHQTPAPPLGSTSLGYPSSVRTAGELSHPGHLIRPAAGAAHPSPLSRDTVRAVEAGEAVRVPPLDQAGVMSSLGSVAPASGRWCAVLRDPHSSTDRDWGLLSVPHWLQIDTL